MRERLFVREVFDTLQGEGARAGSRAVFVRFSGCNLWSGLEPDRHKGKGACAAWCDTDFARGEPYTRTDLLAAMEACWPRDASRPDAPRWCVLTGGEPMLQVGQGLVTWLRAAGWSVAIETNGTIATREAALALELAQHVCVSPKLEGGAWPALHLADELKVVLPGGRAQLDPGWQDAALEALVAGGLGGWSNLHGRLDGRLYVQPQDGHPLGVKRCLEVVRSLPGWRLSVQTHKALGLP